MRMLAPLAALLLTPLLFAPAAAAPGSPEEARLRDEIGAAQALIPFLSDGDARPAGAAHPGAHLWDNGDVTTVVFHGSFVEQCAVVRERLPRIDRQHTPIPSPTSPTSP